MTCRFKLIPFLFVLFPIASLANDSKKTTLRKAYADLIASTVPAMDKPEMVDHLIVCGDPVPTTPFSMLMSIRNLNKRINQFDDSENQIIYSAEGEFGIQAPFTVSSIEMFISGPDRYACAVLNRLPMNEPQPRSPTISVEIPVLPNGEG